MLVRESVPKLASRFRSTRTGRLVASLALSLAMAGTAACSDDDPTRPSNINGTYSLQTIDGNQIPVYGVEDGVLEIANDEWRLTFQFDDGTIGGPDPGFFSRNGTTLTFDDPDVIGTIGTNRITLVIAGFFDDGSAGTLVFVK